MGEEASCRIAQSAWVLEEGPRTLSVPLTRAEYTVLGLYSEGPLQSWLDV